MTTNMLTFDLHGVNNLKEQHTLLDPQLDAKSAEDVKYQDIIYYKYDGRENIKSNDNIHIDFLRAMSEMKNMPSCVNSNDHYFIGFDNKKMGDIIQFIRLNENKWYADVPIRAGLDWDGYYWGCKIDTETLASILCLFFEEAGWFRMMDGWTMRRQMAHWPSGVRRGSV